MGNGSMCEPGAHATTLSLPLSCLPGTLSLCILLHPAPLSTVVCLGRVIKRLSNASCLIIIYDTPRLWLARLLPPKNCCSRSRSGCGVLKMHKLDCQLLDLPSRLLGLFKSIQIFTESQKPSWSPSTSSISIHFHKIQNFYLPIIYDDNYGNCELPPREAKPRPTAVWPTSHPQSTSTTHAHWAGRKI